MSPPRTLVELRRDLARLRANDPKCELFGAIGHRYQVNPALARADVERFESTLGIALPEDYVAFLTEIGNGGAGPFYGIHPLGERDADIGGGTEPWHPRDLSVGDQRIPFPYRDAWNVSPEERDALEECDDSDPRLRDYWRAMDGAIPICHEGCAYRDWLVVSGPERGYVWHDETTGFGGWWPWKGAHGERLTFIAWYEAWLDACLAGRSFDCA